MRSSLASEIAHILVANDKQLLSHGAECNISRAIWQIFLEFLIFCKLISRAFRGVKQQQNMRNEATCNNYFIVKCLLESNVARVILFIDYIDLAK